MFLFFDGRAALRRGSSFLLPLSLLLRRQKEPTRSGEALVGYEGALTLTALDLHPLAR